MKTSRICTRSLLALTAGFFLSAMVESSPAAAAPLVKNGVLQCKNKDCVAAARKLIALPGGANNLNKIKSVGPQAKLLCSSGKGVGTVQANGKCSR